jgi:hypothetical protein
MGSRKGKERKMPALDLIYLPNQPVVKNADKALTGESGQGLEPLL